MSDPETNAIIVAELWAIRRDLAGRTEEVFRNDPSRSTHYLNGYEDGLTAADAALDARIAALDPQP